MSSNEHTQLAIAIKAWDVTTSALLPLAYRWSLIFVTFPTSSGMPICPCFVNPVIVQPAGIIIEIGYVHVDMYVCLYVCEEPGCLFQAKKITGVKAQYDSQ